MAKIKEKVDELKNQNKEVSKQNLEEAAYYHWLNRGCPVNDDLSDWAEAEKQFS